MDRYSFGVELFHLLLHAGLSRRFLKTRQPFPQATAGIATSTVPAVIHVCGTTAAPTATITDLRPATPTSVGTPPDTITEYAA